MTLYKATFAHGLDRMEVYIRASSFGAAERRFREAYTIGEIVLTEITLVAAEDRVLWGDE